jgi:catecholate siderophore receptor
VSTFYGNAADSHVRADVDLASAAIEHRAGGFLIRNRTILGHYDRWYQNYVPGAVADDKSRVALSAYNNATGRLNAFNQTDVTRTATTGRVRHTLLAGAEIGRQLTENFRNTGYFDGVATAVSVPYSNPVISTPVIYRQSATDADNHVRTNLGAAYAQDQAEVSRFVQVIGGVRLDRFDLQYHNNRNGDTLRRVDHLVSPRAGLVIKPIVPLSIYGSYALSYLPSSGDQFSSLTTITQQVKPERFANYEVGAKWDANQNLSMTTALYRLDRTNTRSTDPNDPTRIVQTGSQRTNGYEVGLNGNLTSAWKVAGGYAYQNATVIRATTAARSGAQVGQVPHHTLSLWNNYQVLPRLGTAIGIVRRSDMFAAIDNTVTLPGYTRADAALYFSLTDRTRLQMNVENLFNRTYYTNADSNTNISPGSPRALRVALVAGF